MHSSIYGAFKACRVVRRESFTLVTFDPETGPRTGVDRSDLPRFAPPS
ncbi:hypothetical protein [Streptosporangium sp. NPDC004631]